MKKLNLLETSKAIMFLLIGAGIFMFGAASFFNNPLKADHVAQTNGMGKIMMSESGFLMNGVPFYHILVWDTETGKSKLFVFDKNTTKMITPSYQLPASPLY